MRPIVRSTVGIVAAAASLCFATAAPASAAPYGPVTLSATASPDQESIALTYTNSFSGGADTCTSTVRGVGASGEPITTITPLTYFAPTTTVTVSPPVQGLYAITYTCTGGLGCCGPSSSNDSALFVTVNPRPAGPIGGPTPFGS